MGDIKKNVKKKSFIIVLYIDMQLARVVTN
jgi:hypothetical protein